MPQDTVEGKIPDFFSIETVLGCNLSCAGCYTGAGLVTRQQGVMSFTQYKAIADNLKAYAKKVCLAVWGEPLLNKDILEIIKYTIGFADPYLTTNGQLIDETLAEKIVDSGCVNISVSIDGCSQAVYEKYRRGGRAEKAINALKYLCASKKRLKSNIGICPTFLVFEHNEQEMADFAELCHSLELEPGFMRPFRIENSALQFSNKTKYRPLGTAGLSDKERKKYILEKEEGCFERIIILVDGSVVPCCCDYNGQDIFGNVLEQSILDIWQSKKFCAFRKNLLNGKDVCKRRNCFMLNRQRNVLPDA
ncbi:radical SAM protein [Candidatus Termititenax aidoneus]|uniref:Radical SAM protein n=1 Tax=Termititenax aidoneus TaxID=2218524 RepID=A0A388TAZ0_TERA1|nr:radical SAM protein [Candidatus Termititenax aidoneus]